ncbi:MAG: MlaD family protein [Pseudomonadota bacterium]
MPTTNYMPFEVGARDRIVGLFVIGAVLLFLVGFVLPFVHRLQADEGIPFYTVLDQTYGIAKDASVSLRGVTIGNVTDMGITKDGMVRVDIALSPVYQEFYTNTSRLTVDTNIGVSTILTGSGLILEPANPDNGRMDPGEFIVTDTPQGFASLMEEIDIVQLTDQITEIVANIEEITAGINQNQDKIYRSLDNLETVTASLADVSRTLPGMVASVDTSLSAMQSSLRGVDQMISNTDEDLQATLKNAVALTAQATLTLGEAEILFRETTPLMGQLPGVLITTDIALQSITQLTDQMSRSWLLGGSSESVPVQIYAGPSPHPFDDSIYDVSSKNSPQTYPAKKEDANEN